MREKLIKILRVPIFPHELADPTETVADYLLDNDVVPVVRCRDCKSWKCLREDRGLCKHPTFTLDDDTVDPLTEPDDFCSYGAKMDLEET